MTDLNKSVTTIEKVNPSNTRRSNMASISSKNTSLELRLRSLLMNMGYRGYRIHYNQLPGSPDVAFTKRKKVIFVHGCFWHRHNCRKGKSMPKVNQDFWKMKWRQNVARDRRCLRQIRKNGWDAMVTWECEFKNITKLKEKISKFLKGS